LKIPALSSLSKPKVFVAIIVALVIILLGSTVADTSEKPKALMYKKEQEKVQEAEESKLWTLKYVETPHYKKGQTLENGGNFHAAIEEYEAAVKENRDWYAAFRLGEIYRDGIPTKNKIKKDKGLSQLYFLYSYDYSNCKFLPALGEIFRKEFKVRYNKLAEEDKYRTLEVWDETETNLIISEKSKMLDNAN